MDKIIETYDTTLRFATFEGSEGIKLEERLAIIRMLDSMGITYIDIGTPENSEEYDRFLKQALELQLESCGSDTVYRAKDCRTADRYGTGGTEDPGNGRPDSLCGRRMLGICDPGRGQDAPGGKPLADLPGDLLVPFPGQGSDFQRAQFL